MGKDMDYGHLKEFMDKIEKTMVEGFNRIHDEMKSFSTTQNSHELRLGLLEKEKELSKQNSRDGFDKTVTIVSLIIGFLGLISMFLSLK